MQGKQVRGTGWKHSEETKAKMRISGIGKNKGKQNRLGTKATPETIEKMRQARLGKKQSPETLRKKSEFMKGKPSIMKGKHHSEEAKQKISENSKKHWADPEYKDRTVKSQIRASSRRPTTPEKVVIEMLKEILPNQYQYVGSGHETVINGCNPDFININGQKKVIEVFGDWYHGERKTGKTHEQEEVDKINTYRAFGFDCLIIWEYDTKKHKDKVAKRILAFHRQRHKKLEIQPCLL